MMTGTNVGLSGRSRAGAGEGWHLSAGSGRGWTAPAGTVAESGRQGAAGRTREQDSGGARQESRPDEDGGRSSGRHDFPLSSAQIHLSRYLY